MEKHPKKKMGVHLYVYIAITAVLFIIMLMLCGVYLNLSINGISSVLPEIPANDRHLLSGRGYNIQSGAKSMLSPSFVGFKTADGTLTAAAFDTGARKNLEAYLEESFETLFAGKAEMLLFESDSAKNAYINGLKQSERFVYAAYFSDIPSAAVLPCFHGGVFPKNELNFFLKYLFLLPDENGMLYAVCLDDALNVTLLRPKDDLPYTADSLRAYTGMRGYTSFAFAKTLKPIALYTKSFEVNSVILMPSTSFYSFNLTDENTKKLLTAFDFNSNMVKSFRSGDNSTVSFVEDGKELFVSIPDSTLTFNAHDSGIHMSSFLGYYPLSGNHYSFSDTVLAVKYLLGSFDRILVGGDAAPTLCGVKSHPDGGLEFSLKFLYNGIMISEKAADVTVEVAENRIRKVQIHAQFCDSGSLTGPALPQTLALTLLDGVKENYEYHALFENDPDSTRVRLVWVAGKAGESK